MKTVRPCFALLLAILVLSNSAALGFWFSRARKVAEATVAIPEEPAINIQDPGKFLNDLKLSPYWKVEKDRSGSFVAIARSVGSESGFREAEGSFLFEFMTKEGARIAKDETIQNGYLRGGDVFSSFSACVVFRKPAASDASISSLGKPLALGVFENGEKTIGPNSYSVLGLKLSETHEIYLLLREQGADATRKTSGLKLSAAIREMKRIADLPERYAVAEVYGRFFDLLFEKPLADHDLGRYAGMQDRDTFYGYFKATPDTSYEGINIKVSHPVYCPDEGTRKSSRLQKAEYLGKPYQDGDLMFFLIEDNAVYLSEEHNKEFGTFSGTKSFDGIMELLNGDKAVLLKTTEKFKGWER